MRHHLKISVSKKPKTGGIVACRTVNIRERVLRCLLGDTQKLTILIPGDSVDSLSIKELTDGGAKA